MTLNLHIARHAPSEGNENGIIQGQSYNPHLSENGRRLLDQRIKEGYFHSFEPDIVVCSDLERAQETAEPIGRALGNKVIVDPLLREADPGILAGQRKDVLETTNPSALRIWQQRGDYDGIKGAENGRELQARALTFAYKYSRIAPQGSYLIIGHAAFNRCLINTIESNPRNTPIDVTHLNVTSCSDVFQHLSLRKITKTFSSIAYLAERIDGKYFLKDTAEDIAQKVRNLKEIQNFLHQQDASVPQHFFDSAYTLKGETHIIEVQDYVQGNNPTSPWSEENQNACQMTLTDISRKLMSCPPHIKACQPALTDYFIPEQTLATGLPAHYHPFLQSRELKSFLNTDSEKLCLVEYDCHRENFITNTLSTSAVKVDIGVIRAPSEFQPGCWLAGIALDSPNTFDFAKSVSAWPETDSDVNRIKIATKVRLVMGYSYFSRLLKSDEIKGEMKEKATKLHKIYDAAFCKIG